MFKEAVICIIIIVSIFSLDIFTQGNTDKSVHKITEMLSDLKTNISSRNIKQVQSTIENIDKNWENIHNKLAYYIEHDELEKVDTAIVTMKSYIETDDFSAAVAELEEAKFVLEHIREKNSLNLQNIF